MVFDHVHPVPGYRRILREIEADWRIFPCLSSFVCVCIYIYIPGTQMTPVLNGKGLLLEGSNPKIEDKQVPVIYIYICRL